LISRECHAEVCPSGFLNRLSPQGKPEIMLGQKSRSGPWQRLLPDDGQTGNNRITSCLPTIRALVATRAFIGTQWPVIEEKGTGRTDK
jgi:hypothetical protein